MLLDTTLGTFYHFKLFLMLKQHAYNAGLRQNGLDFWQHPLVFLTLDHFFAKSRSVIAIHLHDPLLDIPVTFDGCVYGKISTLGMSPDSDFFPILFHHMIQVIDGFQLPRGLGQITHVKVLAPAHNRIVCSAERYIDALIIQPDTYHRKLGLFLFADIVDITK